MLAIWLRYVRRKERRFGFKRRLVKWHVAGRLLLSCIRPRQSCTSFAFLGTPKNLFVSSADAGTPEKPTQSLTRIHRQEAVRESLARGIVGGRMAVLVVVSLLKSGHVRLLLNVQQIIKASSVRIVNRSQIDCHYNEVEACPNADSRRTFDKTLTSSFFDALCHRMTSPVTDESADSLRPSCRCEKFVGDSCGSKRQVISMTLAVTQSRGQTNGCGNIGFMPMSSEG